MRGKEILMKRGVYLLLVIALLSGCSTYAVSRYTAATDNAVALRSLDGKTINVGPFTSSQPGQSEVVCRGDVPVKTPDGEPFSEYIRKALVDELIIANAFSSAASITLTGNLDHIGLPWDANKWELALTVRSSNGRSMAVTANYPYVAGFYGDTACKVTAQAFMPAVQDLIGKIVRSPNFMTLISE
jgi:hypothetical protein